MYNNRTRVNHRLNYPVSIETTENMETSNPHNQGYWFVLREDQGNVIFSSNNITTIQNPHIPPEHEQPRYIIETTDRHYPQVPQPPPVQEDSKSSDKAADKWQKPKDEFWDRNKIKLLLTLCTENKNVEKEAPWEEISSIIGATPDQCNSKYRHLRRTYLRILKKKRLGKDVKWVHYNICEEVFSDIKALPPSVLEPWEDNKVRRLLNLYIEYLPRFRKPTCLQKDLWREIAAQLGTTGYNCYHKFKNLKRTYLNWLNRSCETGNGIKWAYHQYFERIYYNYNPGTRPWDRPKIKQLLDAYGQIAHKFRNPKLQRKVLWDEIAKKVGESADACDKKFRNLKQTYTRLRLKASCGRATTKWRYFRDFEEIYYNSARYLEIDGSFKLVFPSDEENYIKRLLEFYIANKDKFKDPQTKNKTLWRMIAPKLGLTSAECDKKFRNLKQTYVRLAWKKKQNGKCSKWPYYAYFDKIYDDVETLNLCTGVNERGRFGLSSIRDTDTEPGFGEALRELHERRASHRRFERLARLAEESNQIQRERNKILQALLDRKLNSN